MNQAYKNLAMWLIIFATVILMFNIMNMKERDSQQISFTEFMSNVEGGDVSSVTIAGNSIKGRLNDGRGFMTYAPEDPNLIPLLRSKDVDIKAEPVKESVTLGSVFVSWFPMLLLIGVWIFFMRQMQGGGKGGAMNFGKSKAKLLTEDGTKVTFADVAGIDEAKEDVQEIIEFLKDSAKFKKLGGKIPKGVLLVGAPGTGKTLLAKAIAGEADVPFFTISGSDFVEMFVGVGASRVRDLFLQGKKSAPCIIFIDEIDAVGRHRGAGLGGGHDEREQTLNQLLVEMDGFESNESVIIIAATNRPDVLDPALLRPGRFDRRVIVPKPDLKGRRMILDVHAKKVPLADDVNFDVIARGTPGFTGADLQNLVNEAALMAAKRNKDLVEKIDFDDSKDKILMGSERKSMIISDEEKKVTAYHEAGHTLVARLIPGTDPIHKVSIIPRGMALGVTQQLPIDERYTNNRKFLCGEIAVFMGGRIAEEIMFKDKSTGAGNDIERATAIARKMVCEWGMSDKLGPVTFGKQDEHIFLGREMGHAKDHSEETARIIDSEIRNFINDNYDIARKLIEDNMDALHGLSELLLDKETIEAKEIDEIIFKGNIPEGTKCVNNEHTRIPMGDKKADEKAEVKEEATTEKVETKAKDDKEGEDVTEKGHGKEGPAH